MTEDPVNPTPTGRQQSHDRQSSSWDIQNAPRNYAWLVLTHVATAFFSFASVWLVTRGIGSDGYGVIVGIVAASQLVQIFVNWSSTSLVRFGIEEFVDTGQITGSFWSRSLIFLPNLLLAILSSVLWLAPVAKSLKIPDAASWLIVVHLATTGFWLHVQYALQGVKMLRLQGALLAIERAMTFLTLLLAITIGNLTIITALWCYILPPIGLSAIGLLILRPYVSFEKFFVRGQVKSS